MLKQLTTVLRYADVFLVTVLVVVQSVQATPTPLPAASEFTEVAPQGFGDRHNSAAWSMQWWNGKLYVGTIRAWDCWSLAWFHIHLSPQIPYPPTDPDRDCASDPKDLPLQAEIWRYTLETEVWERVYQSPNDVRIPGHYIKYTSRDVGFRDMIVFTEPDGTEALYVAGATLNRIWPGLPLPRILRSTDGMTFEPIPQAPGTFLGDTTEREESFRDFEIYNGRLYVINGNIQGSGVVLEAENPAGGNDNFRLITPPGMRVFEMASYNGYLYLGVADRYRGYSVVKTDATGTPPYTFTPLVTHGAFRDEQHSIAPVSMFVFKDRLYVGTDKPAEIIRINPDDSWDLIVGTPRTTPDGQKAPLSGMDSGFDYPLNEHIWRMNSHHDWLYVGTQDASTRFKEFPKIARRLQRQMGFDLYATSNGWHFSLITSTGFSDPFNTGVRTMASTPDGMFLGTNNEYYGTRILRGLQGQSHPLLQPAPPSNASDAALLRPPERLEVESKAADPVVLSWEPSQGSVRYHIFRATYAPSLSIRDNEPAAWLADSFEEIGATQFAYFVDTTVLDGVFYHYFVMAEGFAGNLSYASNLVRAPSLAPVVTFDLLDSMMDTWIGHNATHLEPATVESRSVLNEAHMLTQANNLDAALSHVQQLHQRAQQGQLEGLAGWQAEDMEILLAKLMQRIRLAQAGLIAPADLN